MPSPSSYCCLLNNRIAPNLPLICVHSHIVIQLSQCNIDILEPNKSVLISRSVYDSTKGVLLWECVDCAVVLIFKCPHYCVASYVAECVLCAYVCLLVYMHLCELTFQS